MEKRSETYAGSILFVIMILLGASIVIVPNEVDALQDGDYTYEIGGTPLVATITGYTGAGGSLIIPSTLGGYSVNAIGNYAFSGKTAITSVVIPNTVTIIGRSSFYQCIYLTSVEIPGSVVSIGQSAFYSCSLLESVTIMGSGSTIIDSEAFSCCSSLTSLNLGYGIISIGNNAFSYCGLVSVIIPDSVTIIDSSSFSYCRSLISITLGNSVTTIGDYAFRSCTSLTSIAIPDSVTTIGAEVFGTSSTTIDPCSLLTSVIIGRGVTSIGAMAFRGCGSLVSIKFYGSVAPSILGSEWIYATSSRLEGHAYSTSNFPNPGSSFYGLKMGSFIGVPTNLTATPGNAQVVLVWNAPVDGDITGYKVYRSNIETGTYTLIASPLGLTFTDMSLTNGQTYWYKVSAVNINGDTANTSVVSAVPFTVSNAPTGLTVTPGNAQVTLNWTAPDFNGGRAIDYYVIYQGGNALSVHPTDSPTVITDLNNGQSYSFTIAAHNLAGTGTQSGAVSTMPYTVPNDPTGLTATPGDAQVTLTWSAPFNGGQAIDYYVIYQDGISLLDHPTSLTTIITGLNNGQRYSFSVAAHSSAGIGTLSTVSTTPFTIPSAPTGLTVAPGNSQVILNWTTPVFDGGASIDYYTIYQDDMALPDHPTGSIFVITGLTNGQIYLFSVVAHNQAGTGVNSSVISATPFTVSNAPTGLTLTPGNAQVTLNWTAPVFDGGSSIDYYIVYQDGMALSYFSTGLTTIVTGLNNGHSYSFSVTAHNLAGISAQTDIVSSIPYNPSTNTVPTSPRNIQAIYDMDHITLSWLAPSRDGGLPITGYKLYCSTSEEGTYVLIASPEGLTYPDTNLNNGQIYWYKVSAINAVGESVNSTAISIEVPWSELVPLSGLVVDKDGNGLEGITVTLENGTSTLTDSQGNFAFMAKQGTHTITVDGQGVDTMVLTVFVNGPGLEIGSLTTTKTVVNDNLLPIILAVIAIVAALVAVLLVMQKRKSGK